jgi:hypothetical protein
MDVLMILIAVGFFALTWGLTVLSDRLMGPEGPAVTNPQTAEKKTPILATEPLMAAKAKGR